MSGGWKRLVLSNCESSPPLLFSYEASSKGYTILLTDLAHVWSESLSHKQILSRASKEESSIDPSQDEDQYSVLLQKIGNALNSANKGSYASLVRNEARDPSMKLVTTTELPAPLEPLVWTMLLSQLPQNSLTQYILLPILEGESSRQARMNSLMKKLREKDKVLGKLFDKISSSGVDLSTVFPGMAGVNAGRKGSLFAQAAKVIKGVAPFDENTWVQEFPDEGSNPNIGPDIVRELDGETSPSNSVLQSLEAVPEGWWSHIPTSIEKPAAAKKSHKKEAKQKAPPEHSAEKHASESDDEFERQDTPPRLKSATRDVVSEDAKSTDTPIKSTPEEETPASPPPKSKSKKLGVVGKSKLAKKTSREAHDFAESDESEPPVAKSKAKPKGLGAIGGKKAKQRKRSITPVPPASPSEPTASSHNGSTSPVTKVAVADAATASEDEDVAAPPRTRQEPPLADDNETTADEGPEQPQPMKRRAGSGLGKIGGKKKKDAEERVHRAPTPTPTPPPPTAMKEKDDDNNNEGEKQHAEHNANQGSTETRRSETPPSRQQEKQPISSKPAKRIGKLGMIGGRKKATPKETQADKPSASASSSPPLHKSKDWEEKSQNEEEESIPTRSKSPKRERSPSAPRPSQLAKKLKEEPEPEKEETPEERANRKREVLRKQLETRTKGAGGPVKKKRKF